MTSFNVLHVIAGMDPKMGGVCKAVRVIIAGIDTLGAYNEVVSLDSPDAPYLNDDSFTTHALGTGNGPWAYNDRLLNWLQENLDKYDMVIHHGLWLYPGFALRKVVNNLSKKNKKVPKLFVMPHGMLDPYFQRAGGRKLKAARNWMYWKVIESKLIHAARGILFTCEEEKRLARQTFKPYSPKKEIVVGLGVDSPPVYTGQMRSSFLEKCPAIGNHSFLLFLSRIHEKKGVDLLIDAYSVLYGQDSNRSGTENQTTLSGHSIPKLVIAGPGIESPYGEKIKRLVLGDPFLKEQIYFPGMLSGDAKWGAFYGCEAFVLPSHQENFGIAIVEALGCGKPVLISNQINIWREIEESKGGIIADDTSEGTKKLLHGWDSLSPDDRANMALNARKIFEENFSISFTAQKLMEAITV